MQNLHGKSNSSGYRPCRAGRCAGLRLESSLSTPTLFLPRARVALRVNLGFGAVLAHEPRRMDSTVLTLHCSGRTTCAADFGR